MRCNLSTLAFVGFAAVLAAGCSSSSGGTTPSQPPAATFTITASGVSPKSVTVPRGSQVQFMNNDTRPHDMDSDPHPEHTDCPQINAVGFLNPGQSRQTENLTIARSCGFHDHSNPDAASLRGTIVIQ
jgi:plastocyanin